MKLIFTFQNNLSFFLIVFIFAISCTSNENQHSTQTFIESRTIKYLYVDGKLDSSGTLYERIIYNTLGKDSIIENYDDIGSLYLRTILYYDSTGNKIKTIDYKPAGELESTTKFKYSSDGQILEQKREHFNGGYNQGIFTYNEKGERVKEIWISKWPIDHDGKWYTSEVILLRNFSKNGYCDGVKESVDGKPFKDKKTVFDSLGRIIFEDWDDNFQKYSYDKYGNEAEHLYLDKNNNLVKRWVSVYDTNNVRVEYITYNFLDEPIEVLKKKMLWKKK